jgi:acyl-CoA hydrolase
MTQVVMPNDTNPLGTVFGGRVMEWVDICGAIAAQRHCRTRVTTASLDSLSFLNPIPTGHIVVLQARVNYVGHTSLEVGVKVMSEDPLTGARRHTSTAYLTYVSFAADGSKCEVPRLELETDDDRRRFRKGELRRQQRLSHRPTNTPTRPPE